MDLDVGFSSMLLLEIGTKWDYENFRGFEKWVKIKGQEVSTLTYHCGSYSTKPGLMSCF